MYGQHLFRKRSRMDDSSEQVGGTSGKDHTDTASDSALDARRTAIEHHIGKRNPVTGGTPYGRGRGMFSPGTNSPPFDVRMGPGGTRKVPVHGLVRSGRVEAPIGYSAAHSNDDECLLFTPQKTGTKVKTGEAKMVRDVGPDQRVVTGPAGTKILVAGAGARPRIWYPENRFRRLHGPEEEEILWEEYKRLRMDFDVECKFKYCNSRIVHLEEVWQNNLTVYGKFIYSFFSNWRTLHLSSNSLFQAALSAECPVPSATLVF